MSSLRLALKQSLQESGGGAFSMGHGEKKKRKKKKNVGSVSSNSSSNNNNNNTNSTSSAVGVGPSGGSNITKKGRRNADFSTKRKRGRPRKHHRSERDDDDDEIDDAATLGEDQQPRSRADSRRDRPRNPSRHDYDDEDDEVDDFYSDENEFSYTEDDTDDDVSDVEDVSEDDEDDSRYTRRSRTHQDNDEDEEGEEDETMHSDDDDPQTKGAYAGGAAAAIPSDKKDRKDKTDGVSGEKERLDGPDARKATIPTDGSSRQPKSTSQISFEIGTTSKPSVSSDDEMVRKKLKILKLKKKLEKNQNSAAHKIQFQWKKKKGKGSATSSSFDATTITTIDSVVRKDGNQASKEDTGSTPVRLDALAGATEKQSSTGATESQQKPPMDDFNRSIQNTMDDKMEVNKVSSSDPAATKSSSAAGAAAGDRGNTGNLNSGEAQASSAKKKKKKNNNNGIVPAPTREVREWSQNMPKAKAREYIQVGMRVKVRFATPAKRDGKAKKRYYGGRVTVVSKKRTKIKIKYDDGTSELSAFPDRDVVVCAVDNGEHAVPADKFLPQSEDTLAEVNVDVDESAAIEGEEAGEIPEPPKVNVVAPTTASETEEGEVEETTKSEAVTKQLDSSDAGDIRTAKETKESVVEPVKSDKVSIEAEKSVEAPSTPSSGSSLRPMLKKDKTKTTVSTTNTQREDEAETERAPSASEEEGELSPGITTAKSTDIPSEKQRDQISKVAAEVKPLPLTALLPSKVASETTTTEPIKFATEKQQVFTSKDDTVSIEKMNGNIKPLPVLPTKPKKLSIRIPSDSLATIKGLSSPKSNGIVKSPKSPPSSSNVATSNADDIMTDTPETSKDQLSKRKRMTSDVAHSLDAASSRELPSKKRIKVTIGKNLLENVKKEMNDNAAKVQSVPSEDTSEEGLVKEESVPIVEDTTLAPKAKKKAKKADRARSPRPKSPLPAPEADKISSKNPSSESSAVTPKQQQIGSKGNAFSAKKSIAKEEESSTGPNQPASKTSTSVELPNTSASLRTGRKAAEEAKEKMTVKQKAKVNSKEKEIVPHEPGKKKKKRKRDKEAEEHGEEETEEVEQNETEWVQCDSCKKWRILPDNVKASSLPDLWYCHMNIYDIKRSNCEAPEQNMKQILRERKKRARKRAKREAELSESQHEKPTKKAKIQEEEIAATTTKKKSKNDKTLATGGSTPRSTSPKPPKSAKSSSTKSKESVTDTKKSVTEAKKSNVDGNKKSKNIAEEQPAPADSGSDTQKEVKKKSKKSKKEAQAALDNVDADAADSKKSGRKRGRPSRAQPSSNTAQPTCPPANGNEDEDNVEWVQCDKCEKWRKLPPHISADELPDVWNCSMNTWNPNSASCESAEDKTDAHHQEIGASEWQLRQTHAGKYSYRQLIFGTGARKHNRPLSERSRAAESLFIQQTIDEDQPHRTTQYNKSSAFLPRISNFQKNLMVEENNIRIFDVLRDSNLWEELRSMDPNPSKVLSSSTGDVNIPGEKLKTYEFLSNEIKHAMQDVVLQTLEYGCLTGDEVIGKAQWFPYQTSIKGVAGIRGYCNEDIIIHTLLDLVSDGLVEIATVRDPVLPISQWVPQYRRVGTRRAIEAVESIRASRCMKIAKPWKHRPAADSNTTTTKLVTGENSN